MAATLDRMRDQNGRVVLNSDDLFKMLPRYADHLAERKFLGHALYPVAAEFTDAIYRHLLARPVDENDTVVFTAGGSATGKSTILRTAGGRPGVDFIVDTTFSNAPRAMAQVELALQAGRKVEIHYVYRDFAESVHGMLARANDPKSGRIVPIDDMARTHFGAQRAILQAIVQSYDDPRIFIYLNINENGALRASTEKSFFQCLHESVDNLRQEGQAILDELYNHQKSGRGGHGDDQDPGRNDLYISEALFEAARSQTQARGKNPRQGDA